MSATAIGGLPNILWIVSEDCPPWFGCYGDRLASTPNLDHLAARGVVFEAAFSVAPVCAPSRFSLLTGISAESHGPAHQMRADAARLPWLRTYPEVLRSAGYYCTNNAKTDYNLDIDPNEIWNDSSPTAHWQSRSTGQPFLSVFNFNGTHESSIFSEQPPAVPPESIRLPAYLPDTEEIRRDFAAVYTQIARMDAFVGQLLNELDTHGLRDSTVVIHSSDHGGITPRTKRFCYDEGLRVPLIVATPARWQTCFPAPGSRITTPVSTLAIPPTLIDLAGGRVPREMQDRSLANRDFTSNDLAFGFRNRMDERPDLTRTVRSERFRLIRNYRPDRPLGRHQAYAWQAAGYQSWEREHLAGNLSPSQNAFWQEKAAVELYDLAADPDEVRNLADDQAYREIRDHLDAQLHEHMLDIVDNGFLPEGSIVEGYDASRGDGAYPLDRILSLADAAAQDPYRSRADFLEALLDPDVNIRRWAAIGLLTGRAGGTESPALHRAIDDVPAVRIPAAEALALANDHEAVRTLLDLIRDSHPLPIRIDALDAVTSVDPARLAEHREVFARAADDANRYIRNAGRLMLLRIDGTYEPGVSVFDLATNRGS